MHKEILNRLKANSYNHQGRSENIKQESKQEEKWIIRQMELQDLIDRKEQDINRLIAERKSIPYKIAIGDMPINSRYTKLE